MKSFTCLICLAMMLATGLAAEPPSLERPPNFVVFFVDNLGYGDIGPFADTVHRTPRLDKMAAEGMKLTHFYVAANVCTPSRAALLTGCYPRRVGLDVDAYGGRVLRPVEAKGLHPDELTIAKVLKDAGYATAIYGKWHLGDQPEFLPTRQGFDEYFGTPYSDDMTHDHPRGIERGWPPLPLLRDEAVIEAPVDRHPLVKRCTEEAIDFMRRHREQPFFIYIPHIVPGSTQASFASEAFRGQSANGLYGDAVEELDWSAGAVLDALAELGLDEDTLVIWTADNSAIRRDPPQGSNAPFAGWLGSVFEGGFRVPCLARWPNRIPAGSVCDEVASAMDLLPTFARLAGAALPEGHIIDGHDIWPLLAGQAGARSPYEAFYFFDGPRLAAVRQEQWKLHLPGAAGRSKQRQQDRRARLFDLLADPAEATDLADQHPEVVARLTELAERARIDLGDGDQPGENQRPAGWVEDPRPLLLRP